MAKKIQLTRGQHTLVSDEDYDSLIKHRWFAVFNTGYRGGGNYVAVTYINKRLTAMHTLLLNPSGNQEGDHIDRNPLNNQRENLRIVTRAQNQQNRGRFSNNKCGFKGVCFNKKRQHFYAQLWVNHTRHYLGSFSSKEDAAKAYDEAAKQYHGEYAVLNFS